MKNILAVALFFVASSATAQQLTCTSPEMVPRTMSGLGMTLLFEAFGTMSQGSGPVQFWASEDGNWYMLLIYEDGTACPHMHGTGWQNSDLIAPS